MKIDSTFLKGKRLKITYFYSIQKKKGDILHKSTVRSGEIISSNGNLCIVIDVNAGAILSAKKNIYVWAYYWGSHSLGKVEIKMPI